MDIKRTLSTMLMAGALMLIIMWWMRDKGAAGGAAAVTPLPMYAAPIAQQVGETDVKEEQFTLGNATDPTSKFKLAVTVNNVTAGIEKVQLNIRDFAQTVKRTAPLTLFEAKPTLPKPFATADVIVETAPAEGPEKGKRVVLSHPTLLSVQYIWKFEEKSSTKAVLSATLIDANKKPQIKITKSFELKEGEYEVAVSHKVENLIPDASIWVKIDQLGPTDLSRDDPQGDERFYYAATYDAAKKVIPDDKASYFAFKHVEFEKLAGGSKSIGQMNDFTAKPTLWVASSNRFFTTIVRPLPHEPTATTMPIAGTTMFIPEVHHIQEAHLDLIRVAVKPSENQGIVRLVGASVPVAQKTSVTLPMSVYFGPKNRELLKGDYTAPATTFAYNASAYQYLRIIKYSQNVCWLYSFCVVDGVIDAIFKTLRFFATITFGNFGIAIMLLVLVVRACLHPLTRKSQIAMAKMGKKMREVQPQLESIKKKYAGNKQKLNEEMMRIYRENNVNPAGGIMGCLPMFIQMPIWAALYTGLQGDIALRHASFIPGWINDLSNPDSILPIVHRSLGDPLFTVPLMGWEIYGLNLLPILLLAVFWFQMKISLASQPKPADEQQAQMQKMSQYMIFIFPLMLYNAPSGLNLYIFASTVGGFLDTWLVRKSLKKQGILPQTAENLPTHQLKAAEKKADENKK